MYYFTLIFFFAGFFRVLFKESELENKRDYFMYSFSSYKNSVVTMLTFSIMDNFGVSLKAYNVRVVYMFLFFFVAFILSIVTIFLMLGVFYSQFKKDYEEQLVAVCQKYNKIPKIMNRLLKENFVSSNHINWILKNVFGVKRERGVVMKEVREKIIKAIIKTQVKK